MKLLDVDGEVLVTLSSALTAGGTGLGWIEPEEDEGRRYRDIEDGDIIRAPALIARILGAISSWSSAGTVDPDNVG